ncbi:MAG: type II CRISPR RNA-guided endonuclease Cas9 [Spirochaetales bacterium]|nr:type II CRISPR RNA-guided endonuclease Cas9 [Spirochaetales bacterium]
MTYRLGLDLGTNSIGWALWELGENGPKNIIDMGVRIFSDGRSPSKSGSPGDPLAVKRRDARSMRRRRDRFLQRKRNLVNVLIREKLWPKSPSECVHLYSLDPYELREKALYEPLSKEELGRIFLHLCQRRGFKSNRKENSKDKENGIIKQKIEALNKELEAHNTQTIGEYLNANKTNGIRFRGESKFYPERSHYLAEFELIRDKQKKFFPQLNWKEFEKVIFFQRPLKPQQRGTCRYYEDQPRAHKSLPSSHHFRILQELSNLRMIGDHGEIISLSTDEFHTLYEYLDTHKKAKFSQLRKLLGTDFRFNLESERRDKLNGNEIAVDFRKDSLFGKHWDHLDSVEQDNCVECIMEAEDEQEIVQYLEQLSIPLSNQQKKSISEITLPKGVGRYCAQLHRECSKLMYDNFCGYSDALKMLNFNHSLNEGDGSMERLPYYGEAIPESCIVKVAPGQNKEEATFGKIGNPTVHIALNQLRKVMNSLIMKHGKPAEISLELSRDLKLGKKALSQIVSTQTKNKKINDSLRKEIQETHKLASCSRMDIEKLRYYEELRKNNTAAHCPYCGEIIRAEELFQGSIEIEHILPFSRTLDDSRANKTIAHRSCNALKRERSPYEAFGSNPIGFTWEDIQNRSKKLPSNKQWRFTQNAMERFENEESGFLQRQMTDNAYIAKVARRYLTAICPSNKVWGVSGKHTAVLRRKWNLNAFISIDAQKKNRSDHRHHAIDAAVIGLTDRSLVKKIADLNKQDDHQCDFQYLVPPLPGGHSGYQELEKKVKEILPSFKQEHGIQGRFFKETAYGKISIAMLYDTVELQQEDVEKVVPKKKQEALWALSQDVGFNKAKQSFAKECPEIRVLKEYWVTRKPLTQISSLSDFDAPGKNAKNSKGLVDFELRSQIKEYIDSRPGAKLEKVLEEYSRKKGIKHVRYIPKNQEIYEIPSSLIYRERAVRGKGYELDGYAYVDIWRVPTKKAGEYKFEGQFISYFHANQIQRGFFVPDRPHPAAKKMMRLYKQDTLSYHEDDGVKYFRVEGLAPSLKGLDLQPIWATDKNWHDSVNHDSVHGFYKKTGKQNFLSINVLLKKEKVRKITVHQSGGIR